MALHHCRQCSYSRSSAQAPRSMERTHEVLPRCFGPQEAWTKGSICTLSLIPTRTKRPSERPSPEMPSTQTSEMRNVSRHTNSTASLRSLRRTTAVSGSPSSVFVLNHPCDLITFLVAYSVLAAFSDNCFARRRVGAFRRRQCAAPRRLGTGAAVRRGHLPTADALLLLSDTRNAITVKLPPGAAPAHVDR